MAEDTNAVVVQRIEITPQLIKLRVVPDSWELPDFTPGQFGVLALPSTAPRCETATTENTPQKDPDKLIKRAYSIASSSVAKEYLEYYIGLVHTGALSPRLFALGVGDKLWMSPRFKGMFTLSEVDTKYNAVLIATGTGVAPYMSMIRSELSEGLRRRFAVIHGACHSVDLGYHNELRTLNSLSEGFAYLPILSHAHEEALPWTGYQGFVQKLWTDGTLEKAWGLKPKPEDTHVFLCGNPLMIDGMMEILSAEGFQKHSKKNPGQVHTEQFFVRLDQ